MHYTHIDLIYQWLYVYGPLALFVLLAVGIIGLPVPEDLLMIAAGVLIAKGKLSWLIVLIAAYAGSMCGITVSYLLGFTAGYYLIIKYGARIGITRERLEYAHNWYERIGKWTLFFGYFFPGIRHFSGYVAGTSRLDGYSFMLFAYSGAVVWATLFLSVGYFFGTKWDVILELVNHYLAIVVALILLILIIYFLVRHYIQKK